jgi:Na+-translocating ferredoxin:NAD+ oxidoreductase RnfC subunit
METIKYCSKCDTIKSIEQFSKYKRSADGHSWTCKSCIKEYQLANKEKMKAYQRDYQPKYKAEHGEKLREYTRTYLKTVGKERHTAYLNKWRAEHPEKVKEYIKISRERAKAKKQLNDQ